MARALLAALVLLLAAVALWPHADDAPLSNATTTQPGTTTTTAASEQVPMAPALTMPTLAPIEGASRTEVPAAGVFGVVLDHEGRPIADMQVKLLGRGRPEHERRLTRTDSDGRFAFPSAFGDLEFSIWSSLPFTRSVHVEAGEHRLVELRAGEPCVLLEGVVSLGDRPVARREVFVRGADALGSVDHKGFTDDQGRFRHLVRPGIYSLFVAGPVAFNYPGHEGEAFHLAATPTRVHHDIALPPARIRVLTVTRLDGALVLDASVSVTSTREPRGTWQLTPDARGMTTFTELEPGDYTVTTTAQRHLTTPPLVVTASIDAEPVTIRLAPAGALAVSLIDRAGPPLPPGNGACLRLTMGNEVHEGKAGGNLLAGGGQIHFDSLPTGLHVLTSTDVVEPDGSLTFASYEPIAPKNVQIKEDEDRQVQLIVDPRPVLQIQARNAAGELVPADIRVQHDGTVIHPSAVGATSWFSAVARGDYHVTVSTAGGQTAERDVNVVTNQDLVVKLP